jgi:MFS family permease
MSGEAAKGGPNGFRRLLTADTFSVFGDQLLSVALPLYLFDVTGSAGAAAAAALARAVPVALLGVAGGALADRHDTRRVLVAATAIRTLCVLPLLLPLATNARQVLVYGVALSLGVLSALAQPAVGASLPLVVRPDDLPASNAKLSARTVAVQLVAPSAGAVIYARAGLSGVVVVNATLFLLACFAASALRLPQRARTDRTESWRAALLGGLAHLRTDRQLSTLTVAAVIAVLGLSLQLALLVPYVRDVLDGSRTSVGLLTTGEGLGGLLGAVCAGWLGRRLGPRSLVTVGMFGLPASGLSLLVSSSVPRAVPGVVCAGLLLSLLTVGFQTLVQTVVPLSHLGRVLGVFSASFGAAAVVGTATAVSLSGVLGLRGCFGLSVALEAAGLAFYLARR